MAEGLVRLDPVCQIVRTAIWSGRVAGVKPVSLCLIAPQESAKSAALLLYATTKTVVSFSDLTSKGVDSLKPQIESQAIRHIVALDLIRIVSHGRFVSERTIQTLAGLMEEGQGNVADAGGMDTWKGMPNIGLLCGVTPAIFYSRRGHWRATGFLTRFLPVNFHYSEPTRARIHHGIAKGLKTPKPEPQNVPDKDVAISLGPSAAQQIEAWAIEWGLQNQTYGFRHHRQLRALAQARALMAGRDSVQQKDLDTLYGWRQFFSSSQPVVI